MQIYSIVMFCIAAGLIVCSFLIYRGNTKLIPGYQPKNGRANKNYTKELGRALFIVTLAPYLSGILAMFGNSDTVKILSVFVLVGVFVFGWNRVKAVNKKYNMNKF